MQLKGLVRFFAIALILICLYQLSFTWIVRNYEGNMQDKAEQWVKNNYPSAEQKYPSDKELKTLYADTLKEIKDSVVKRLLDSTKDTKIGPFGLTSYRSAKDKELMLGLDLQGGMSVTMQVGMDGLIKSLSDFTKDAAFNSALEKAVEIKANSGADLISLFYEQYTQANPGINLAPFFAAKSNGKITFTSSNSEVVSYLKSQSVDAFNNTLRILRARIDRFGIASPNINPDPSKGIISIELAGINDPERVRNYLQSTANLQFFEVYTLQSQELVNGLQTADKVLQDFLNGNTDSLKTSKDSSSATATKATAAAAATKTPTDSNATASLSQLSQTKTTTGNTKKASRNIQHPLQSLLIQASQPYRGDDGKVVYPAELAMIQIKDTAVFNHYMTLSFVKNAFPSNLVFMYGKANVPADNPKAQNLLALYAIKTLDNGQAELEGDHISDASQDFDENGRIAIKMDMDKVGTNIWSRMTTKNIGKPIAIVLDNFVYSAPNVMNAITTGNSQITGNYSLKEAQDMAEILKSGKLPAPAKIVQEQVVGPTLGHQAIVGGLLSFGISFLVIFGLMLIYYNTGGWVANIALILNLFFTVGILSAMGFTLTAPGIAGLVLTIGMAVDTNVIIFERIKEELSTGLTYPQSVSLGYRRSLAPVLDAHVTSLLTAIILAYFGLGPVLGFATTQIIGLLLSLFCGILISRVVTDIYTQKNRHFQYFTSVSKKIFQKTNFKFIEFRKVAYVITALVFIGGISTFFHGFDYGVEFSGGRSYTIKFNKPTNPDDIRGDLTKVFGEEPIIKTIGNNQQLEITTAYLIKQTKGNVDSMVERALYTGLQKHLAPGTDYSQFDKNYKQNSQTVLPSISDDLKLGSEKATIFAIIIICIYIFIRFRDWRYSFGTIFALLHDVFVTLIVFSFLKKVGLPFSLQIDQYFIAAILTVIGYSMNDTIIVYDRIREDSKLFHDQHLSNATIIDRAINQTLSRTVMTSLAVFLTILILFIFGGEVTRGFAFAMLIGVITGTYSSIFVAAPILVDFAKSKPLGTKTKVKKTKAVS